MSENKLLKSSILNTLFSGGKRRKIDGKTYSNTGDKTVLISALTLFHIVGVLNVSKLCDLTSSANAVILGMFGGYVGGFFMFLMLLFIISKSRMKVYKLLWWKWILGIFVFILLILAIVAMAMSNKGSSEEKGYGYTSVIMVYIAIIIIIWYYVRMQIKITPGTMEGDSDRGSFMGASNSNSRATSVGEGEDD